MTIQDAIEKAIEGGWKPTKYLDYSENEQVQGISVFISRYAQHMALLDPLFWQALGRAMGWPNPDLCGHECGYKHFWHHLIDHLADGGSIESFFEKIV